MIRTREISRDELEIAPEGNLSREDTREFQTLLDEALRGGHHTIALNFERLASLSSSAIGKILHFKARCDEACRRFVIRKCNPEMLRLLRMIKFDALISIEP